MSNAKYYLPASTQLTALAVAPTLVASAGGSLGDGNYIYAVSYLLQQGESLVGNLTAATASGGASTKFTLTNISVGPSYCLARNIYRTAVDDTTLKYCATINDNTTTNYVDTLADAALGSDYSASVSDIDPSLNVNGILNVNAFVYQTAAAESIAYASIANGVTCNAGICKITITGANTPAADNGALNVYNYYVSSASTISATVNSYSGTLGSGGLPVISITSISTGKFTINIMNPGTSALAGTLVVFCQIIN